VLVTLEGLHWPRVWRVLLPLKRLRSVREEGLSGSVDELSEPMQKQSTMEQRHRPTAAQKRQAISTL